MPYPADTRAKGWRFELDYERIEQSDTWDVAAEVPMAGAALLMMWYQAWKQVPCGSMPADDDALRAKCRVPVSMWPTLRPILLRGWWLAEDGRLYHGTLVQRVQEMLAYRKGEADRRGKNRAKLTAKDGGPPDAAGTATGDGPDPPIVPDLSRGTSSGLPRESHGVPDTGTGTGTYVSPTLVAKAEKSSTHRSARSSKIRKPDSGAGGEVPTAGEVFGARLLAMALVRAGVSGVGEGDHRLLALARADVSPDELEGAARAAVKAGAEHPLAWATARVAAQRREAQALAIAPAAVAASDPDSREAIEADGVRFGFGRWVSWDDATGKACPWPVYRQRVLKARAADVAGGAGVAP